MPQIRKKTSNRGTTNDRRKITNKVRESRKKKTKAAKKNVTWKSKHKKDPGIPSAFPYKDQILAEVAEERRRTAEEKALKSANKKSKKQPPEEEEEDPQYGVASLHDRKLVRAATSNKQKIAESDDEMDDDVPLLVNRDLPTLQAVLEKADVIIEVLDARDPLSFRSKYVETLATSSKDEKILLVLNKVDASCQEAVGAWAANLEKDHRVVLFRSASRFLPEPYTPGVQNKGKSKEPVGDALGVQAVLDILGEWSKGVSSELTVAVTGVTNVGKSSFINSILKKAVLPIYTLASSSRGPTTTSIPHEVEVELSGKTIRFIDTPGFSWEQVDAMEDDADEHLDEKKATRARDILLRNKGRIDRLKDPTSPVSHLISRANSEDLMPLYNLPAFSNGDLDAFLAGVARSQQLVKKRGTLDILGAARLVLRDWCFGKLNWYTFPQGYNKSPVPRSEAQDVEKALIASLPTRKELRSSGAIKLSPGVVEERNLDLDLPYQFAEDNEDAESFNGITLDGVGEPEEEKDEDEEDGDDNADEDSADGSEEQDDEMQDVDDEEEEEPAPPPKGSQKRKRSAQPPLPRKKPPPPKAASKPAVAKKAVPAKKQAPKSSTQANGEPEAYDFGKYF